MHAYEIMVVFTLRQVYFATLPANIFPFQPTKGPAHFYFVFESIEGSGELEHLCRLALAFVARHFNKYFRMCKLMCLSSMTHIQYVTLTNLL